MRLQRVNEKEVLAASLLPRALNPKMCAASRIPHVYQQQKDAALIRAEFGSGKRAFANWILVFSSM